ncbi:hypothetical protein LCGC14_1437010 [marine sediment metagenome]|uniref:Uncharacterized protein n=1 Tax=marine sediment metagenome TaxID=412755 RepID=A0A0F9K833_9ZZZZ
MTKFKSEYSPAQTQMIMCMTRGHECRWEDCLKCGYLRDEVMKKLHERQAEWDKEINP